MTKALRNFLWGLFVSAFGSMNATADRAGRILSLDMDGSWNIVAGYAQSIFAPFCYTIIAICLMLEIAQVAAKVDVIKWEHGLKLAVKMVLAKVCIDIAPTVLRAIYEQCASWIQSLNAAVSGDDGITAIMETLLDTLVHGLSGLGTLIGMIVTTAFVILAVKICGLIIQIVAYARVFEILVYVAVSPIPCAFMPLGDGSGSGVSRITSKFFKNFIAVCLQGIMLMVILIVFGAILNSYLLMLIGDVSTIPGLTASIAVGEFSFAMLLGSIALVMAATKSGGWAKSIIDAT